MSYDKTVFRIISIIIILISLYVLFGCKNKQVQCEAYSAIDNKNTILIDSLGYYYE